MDCPNGHPNADGQKFCGECAAPLDDDGLPVDQVRPVHLEKPHNVSTTAARNRRPWVIALIGAAVIAAIVIAAIALSGGDPEGGENLGVVKVVCSDADDGCVQDAEQPVKTRCAQGSAEDFIEVEYYKTLRGGTGLGGDPTQILSSSFTASCAQVAAAYPE